MLSNLYVFGFKYASPASLSQFSCNLNQGDTFLKDIDFSSPFLDCNSLGGVSGLELSFIDELILQNCIDYFEINWGDSVNESWGVGKLYPLNQKIFHNYNGFGEYNITITLHDKNGKIFTQTEVFKSKSNPAGGINSPGGTGPFCAPSPDLTFTISDYWKNTADTLYEVDFGDGTVINYTQADLINSPFYNALQPDQSASFPITKHSFKNAKCDEDGYTVTLTITNECSETVGSVNKILVFELPEVEFLASSENCVENTVGLDMFFKNEACFDESFFAMFLEIEGVLKGPFSKAQIQDYFFNYAGDYQVNLVLKTGEMSCDDVIVPAPNQGVICVKPKLDLDYELDQVKGCAPLDVLITNNTDTSGYIGLSCAPNNPFVWSVKYEAENNCGASKNVKYIGGTNRFSNQPKLRFNTPGKYTIVLKPNENSCGGELRKEVIVKAPPKINIDPISDFCDSGKITPSYSLLSCSPDPQGVLSENWQIKTPGETVFRAFNFSENFTEVGAYSLKLTVTDSDNCGASVPDIESFEILAIPQMLPINDIVVCSGEEISDILFSSNATITAYDWMAVPNADLTGYLVSGSSPKIPRQVIYNTSLQDQVLDYIITPKNGQCVGGAELLRITVHPKPEILKHPESFIGCEGFSPSSLEVQISSGFNDAQFQWFSSSSQDSNTFTPITGANESSYLAPTSNAGITYYYCEINVPSLEPSCQKLVTEVASISVYSPLAIVGEPIAYQEICYDASLGMQEVAPLQVNYSGGYGQISFQWFRADNSSGLNKTPITGSTSHAFTPNNLSSPGNYYYLLEAYSEGLGCDSAMTDYAHVKITNGPQVLEDPLAYQKLCLNAFPEVLEIKASEDHYDLNYQWYKSLSPTLDLDSAQLLNGEVSSSFSPPTNQSGSFYYFCQVYSSMSSDCSNFSDIAQVEVSNGLIITSATLDEIFCLNDTPPELSASYINGVGTPDYQWFVNTIPKTDGAVQITGANESTYTPVFETQGTFYYYCKITFPGEVCGEYNTPLSTIELYPFPEIADKNLSICSGDSFNLIKEDLEGNIPDDTKFIWEVHDETGKIKGLTDQNILSDEISASLINDAATPLTALYEITPVTSKCVGKSFKLTVEVGSPLKVSSSIRNNECIQGQTGAIELEITGGSQIQNNYNFNWSGPLGFSSQTQNINNLKSGVYLLEVEDDLGCSIQSEFEIIEPDEELQVSLDPNNEMVCLYELPQELRVNVNFSRGQLTYQWFENTVSNPLAGFPKKIIGANQPNYIPEAKTIKTVYYYCQVTSDCGTYYSNASLLKVQPKPFIANKALSLCNETGFDVKYFTGNSDIVPDGTQFIWEVASVFNSIEGANSNADISESIKENKLFNNALEVGQVVYFVTPIIGDCAGEPFTLTISVQPTIEIDAEVNDNICAGEKAGSIEIINQSFINGAYSYLWAGPRNFISTSKDIYSLESGVYQLSIKSELGCERQFNFEVGAPTSSQIFNDAVVSDISCNEASDGAIKINLSGGLPPYRIEWEGPNGFVSNSTEIIDLSEGVYQLKVYNNACNTNPYEAQYIIEEPGPLEAQIWAYNGSGCNETSTGRIEVLVKGGEAPYEVLYNSETTTGVTNGLDENNVKVINGLEDGAYQITIQDRNGCVISDSFKIESPEPMFYDVGLSFDKNCEEGTSRQYFKVNVYGGTPPFEYFWSNGIVESALNVMYTEQNGFIEMYVVDANNCRSSTYSYDVVLPASGLPDFDIDSQALYDYGIYSVEDPVRFYNSASGDYISVSWDFGDGSFSSELNPTHIYKREGIYEVVQVVTYASGCVLEKRVKISIDKGYKLFFPDAFTPNQDQLNDYFSPIQEGLEQMEFSVYDTWGSLIYFEKGDNLRGWDGLVRNKRAENGNYYYRFKAKTFYGAEVEISGAFISIY